MKNIIKKKNTYYADFRNDAGTRIRQSLGKDLAQAEIKLRYLISGIKDPSVDNSDAGKGKVFSIAVNEFISRYYGIDNAWDLKKGQWDRDAERQAQLVTKTLKTFKKHSRVHYVAQAGLPKIERFIDAQIKLVAPGTVNKYINFLKAFFRFCEKREYIVKSKAESLEKLPVKTSARHSFSDTEVEQILSNAGDFLNFCTFALNTGLRPCDMWNLSQDDFIVEDGNMYFKTRSKKTKEELHVPINSKAQDVVKRAGSKLFPNANRDIWRKALLDNLRSNFDEDYVNKHKIKLHTLRHTYAINRLNSGVPKEAIQAFLGHSSVQTTEIYCNQMSKKELDKWV